MEYSSPLAAMRPQPCVAWGNRKDLPLPRSMRCAYQSYNPPQSFDFKNMSMHQQKPAKNDYFSVKPVRGSSPTSTLTADLGANFHIDKSPQAPTPRRSLFTETLLMPQDDAGRLMTPPIEGDEVTTPDLLSSSPGIDAMDVSPLPHKTSHFVSQVTLPSPSPEITPDVEDDVSPDLLFPPGHPIAQVQPNPAPAFLQLPERRRAFTRPSISHSKSHTASYGSPRPSSAETNLPPFRFGNVATNHLSCASTPSLLESFTESPVEDQQTPVPHMQPPPRRPSLSSVNRNVGAQYTNHVRKPSGGRQALPRPPRKLMRRSLSMFQHPDDVMKEEQDNFEPQPSLASVMDVDQEHRPRLPCFIPDSEPDSLPRISQDTMVDILNSKYNFDYERILVVDCRFEYEYNGGHIEGAVNFNDKLQLAHELFPSSPSPDTPSPASQSTLLIFHCEYSVHRAPLTAKFIRNADRTHNAAHYPRLSYPEMYILDGGYSKFFSSNRSKCFPQSYVEMNDTRHELACERGMAKVKMQTQRQRLFRNQTFAFGERSPLQGFEGEGMDDSPTAALNHAGGVGRGMAGRSQSYQFRVGESVAEGIGASFARRMASY